MRSWRPPTSTASRSCSIWCRTTPPTSTPGSRTAAPPDRARGATGISGAIRRRTAARRTTGGRNSAAARGSGTQRTGQYYYHAFLAAQPDLNWRNPAVRAAMHEVMRFWLRRGVDGFRVDVIWHLLKDDRFRDNPLNPGFQPGQPPHHAVIPLYTTDLPEVHEAIAGLRRVLDEFPDRVLLGEIYLPIERLVAYYGRELEGTHLPFNFTLLQAPWRARDIAKLIDDYEAALPRGRLAQLGARQPRPAAHCGPRRARTGAHRRHAAAHPEGNADHLLWRRDRDAAGADPARSRVRPVRAQCARTRLWARRRPHPDAMGCHAPRGLFPGGAVAAGGDAASGRTTSSASGSTPLPSTTFTAG